MTSAATRGLLADMLRVLERPGPLVILPHDNPDPDSMASAVTLKYLAHRFLEKDAYIALGGIVGRAENRAMVRYLNIPLVAVADLPLCAPDTAIALVMTTLIYLAFDRLLTLSLPAGPLERLL